MILKTEYSKKLPPKNTDLWKWTIFSKGIVSFSHWLVLIAEEKEFKDDGNLSDLFLRPFGFWMSHKFIFMVFHSTQLINFTTYFGNFYLQAIFGPSKCRSFFMIVTLYFTKKKVENWRKRDVKKIVEKKRWKYNKIWSNNKWKRQMSS